MKPGRYEGNFRPGMGYVAWKMAGFPKDKAKKGWVDFGNPPRVCIKCKTTFFPSANTKSRICSDCDKAFLTELKHIRSKYRRTV